MARKVGSKNRNYPPLTLLQALRVPTTIQDEASGMTVSRLTLSKLLDTTPSSSTFRDLVGASRFYGLTEGGINGEEYSLSPLGREATGGDEVARSAAFKKAVLNVPPFEKFFRTFSAKKWPNPLQLRDFLVKEGNVPEERLDECIEFIRADAETAGFLMSIKGGQYIDLGGAAPVEDEPPSAAEVGDTEELEAAAPEQSSVRRGNTATEAQRDRGPAKKVFIAHGKNRKPLDQLKKALDQFNVSYAVAVDEPHGGRPISRKVAELMRDDCSSGIFIFTADEQFLRAVDGGTEEVWRPSENVVYELGAASMLYDNRIVIFKEKGVSFPSDFSDLGYLEFEKDSLVAEIGNLFAELVKLNILEVRAKS